MYFNHFSLVSEKNVRQPMILFVSLNLFVTFSRKTYTNGFPLNGSKVTANQRLVNGFSNTFNGVEANPQQENIFLFP